MFPRIISQTHFPRFFSTENNYNAAKKLYKHLLRQCLKLPKGAKEYYAFMIKQNILVNSNKKLKDSVKVFAPYKSELTVSDGLIFKGKCLTVPKSLQSEMLTRIHYSHLGINKCIKLAQESLFWPGMVKHIKDKISLCHQCLTYANSQVKEPLKSHEIPLLPWNKVSCDIFELKGRKYLLIVDYYSKYIEVEDLANNTNSNSIIQHLKSIFSRHGIPLILITDGGTQLRSKEFEYFCKEWEFEHVITSPTNAQSNGMAERNVQTAKQMFKKILDDKKNIQMALLHYRSTPIFDNISPAELLMSRKLRTNLMVTKNESKPKISNTYNKSVIIKNQQQQQKYYNRGKRMLPQLNVNEKVYVQREPQGKWFPGVVLQRVRYRDYRVQMDNGSVLIRNRKFIKKINVNVSLNNENHYSSAREEKIVSNNSSKHDDLPQQEIRYFIELENTNNNNANVNVVPKLEMASESMSDNESKDSESDSSEYEDTLTNETVYPESDNTGISANENSSDASDYLEEIKIVITKESDSDDSDLERQIYKKINVTNSGRVSKPPSKFE